MRIISNRTLVDFAKKHPHANTALQGWRHIIEKNSYKNWSELKRTFNTVDKINELTVFNIGGNKYRLIAFIRFEKQILYIKNVLTHNEYDKNWWKND